MGGSELCRSITLHRGATVRVTKGWCGEEVRAARLDHTSEGLMSGRREDDMESAGVPEDFFHAFAAILALAED